MPWLSTNRCSNSCSRNDSQEVSSEFIDFEAKPLLQLRFIGDLRVNVNPLQRSRHWPWKIRHPKTPTNFLINEPRNRRNQGSHIDRRGTRHHNVSKRCCRWVLKYKGRTWHELSKTIPCISFLALFNGFQASFLQLGGIVYCSRWWHGGVDRLTQVARSYWTKD